MKYFFADARPQHLTLRHDLSRSLQRGYPWVFADQIESVSDSRVGALAVLKDKSRKIVAKGFYAPDSKLAFRVCALGDENLDDALIEHRLHAAYDLRRRLFEDDTTGFRLINGEGDGLPGLVCDIYFDTAVIQLDGGGPAQFWNVETIGAWLVSALALKRVYLKKRAKDGEDRVLTGTKPPRSIQFRENGVQFLVDIVQGQKTGFFLDQRANRQCVRRYAHGLTVLNLFGYTGGFSVSAGLGGARSVITVDSAAPAIAAARENWSLNNLPASKHEGVVADAFEYLEKARLDKRSWDFVIADPPSFAPSKAALDRASSAYRRLFEAAARVVTPGGLLALSSCSSHVTPQFFLDLCEAAIAKARRRARVLTIHGQPEDHPFPLACRELQYLKFVLFELHR